VQQDHAVTRKLSGVFVRFSCHFSDESNDSTTSPPRNRFEKIRKRDRVKRFSLGANKHPAFL
jgi:hypothetical protein